MFELSTNVASPQRLRRGDYSAYDALYLGDFSCLDYPENYCADPESLADAAACVAALGKKCYLRLHAVPSNHELPLVRRMIEAAMPLQFDAFEVHNLGVLQMLREMGCTKPVHLGRLRQPLHRRYRPRREGLRRDPRLSQSRAEPQGSDLHPR